MNPMAVPTQRHGKQDPAGAGIGGVGDGVDARPELRGDVPSRISEGGRVDALRPGRSLPRDATSGIQYPNGVECRGRRSGVLRPGGRGRHQRAEQLRQRFRLQTQLAFGDERRAVRVEDDRLTIGFGQCAIGGQQAPEQRQDDDAEEKREQANAGRSPSKPHALERRCD